MNRTRQILESTPNQPVVCELTAGGRGAVCVLAVAGTDIVSRLEPLFRPVNGKPLGNHPCQKPVYGYWDKEDLIVCVHSDSFAEVHCHGGDQARNRVVADLVRSGFTKQLWTGISEMPDTASAAFRELVSATTPKTAAVLTWQVEGALDAAMTEVNRLIESGEHEGARQKIESLIGASSTGLHLVNPWLIAIAGAPNAGKSSLVNRVVGFGRSIVCDKPGTTRDLVTVETAIDGWPVKLIDTAGMRSTADSIERIGVALAQNSVQEADVIIEVIDATCPGHVLGDDVGAKRIPVLNKCDLADPPSGFEGVVISAMTGEGLDDLLKTISRTLVPVEPEPDSAVPFLATHVEWLNHRLAQLSR